MRGLILALCTALLFVACKEEEDAPQSQNLATSQIASESTPSQSAQIPPPTSQVAQQKLPDPEVLYRKCASCHGKDGKSIAPGSVNGVLIASLNKDQARELLKGFRARSISRGGNSISMYMQTQNLSDADIEALATYIDAF